MSKPRPCWWLEYFVQRHGPHVPPVEGEQEALLALLGGQKSTIVFFATYKSWDGPPNRGNC